MIAPITTFPIHWLFELATICLAFVWGRALVLLLGQRAVGWTITPLGASTYLLVGLWLIAMCGVVLRLYMPLQSPLALTILTVTSCASFLYVIHRDRINIFSVVHRKQAIIFCIALSMVLPFGLGDWGIDAGLYHMTKAMHVAQTENITGLGLLKSYFATNPLTDILRGWGLAVYPSAISIYFINDVMMLIFVLFLLQLVFLEQRELNKLLGLSAFAGLWLSAGTENYFDRGIADFTATVTTSIVYMSLFVTMQESSAVDQNIETENRYFTLGVIACVFAVLTKLSAAPAAMGFIFYWLFLRSQPEKSWWQSRRLGLFFVFPVLLSIIIWLMFHKMVSGCWLYPIASTCEPHTGFHLIADYDRLLILLHSRVPGDYFDPANQAIWWVHWWAKWKSSLILWGMVSGILLTLIAYLFPASKTKQTRVFGLAGCAIIVFLAAHTAYWGITAPDVRYGNFLRLLWLSFGLYFVANRYAISRLLPVTAYITQRQPQGALTLTVITLLVLCNFNPLRLVTPLQAIPEATLTE